VFRVGCLEPVIETRSDYYEAVSLEKVGIVVIAPLTRRDRGCQNVELNEKVLSEYNGTVTPLGKDKVVAIPFTRVTDLEVTGIVPQGPTTRYVDYQYALAPIEPAYSKLHRFTGVFGEPEAGTMFYTAEFQKYDDGWRVTAGAVNRH
jgi:hypothetical protein